MRARRRFARPRRSLTSATRKNRKRLLAVSLLFVALGASQTFAASNTVPATYAGAGTQTVTTPTYSNITVLPNRDSPQVIRQVSFTASAPSATYTIAAGSGAFTGCANSAGSVICTAIAGASLLPGQTLTIKAR